MNSSLARVGAQWSASQGVWIGWLWDGRQTIMFDHRSTRELALKDAWDHYDRLFHPEEPKKRWTP